LPNWIGFPAMATSSPLTIRPKNSETCVRSAVSIWLKWTNQTKIFSGYQGIMGHGIDRYNRLHETAAADAEAMPGVDIRGIHGQWW
jgi:hypothetical protein